MPSIRLATRGSPLALCQSVLVQNTILATDPSLNVELFEVTTTGDRQREWSLEQQGGTGLFTKELENLLLAGDADIAVHSSKDLPGKIVDGLTVAGYLPREQVHDVLVLREGVQTPITIATGSPRRREQLGTRFPDVEWLEIRGNVETRLDKIQNGYADATVLAAAGLNRLGIKEWDGTTFHSLAIEAVVPSPGQGAIAVQCREGETGRLPNSIFCQSTFRAVSVEKRLMSLLGGGCHSCIGAHLDGDRLLVFHENCRFYEYRITGEDELGIEEQLDEIVANLSS